MLGSIRAVTDSAGQVVARFDYEPFGLLIEQAGPASAGGERYTGKPRDAALGLYYFGARYYDPGLGRFITADPARDGLNWYAYCDNNPVAFVDPLGLFKVSYDEPGMTWEGEVEPGDTLWGIADRFYGDSLAWIALAHGNAIEDPRQLAVGQSILIPGTLYRRNGCYLRVGFDNGGAVPNNDILWACMGVAGLRRAASSLLARPVAAATLPAAQRLNEAVRHATPRLDKLGNVTRLESAFRNGDKLVMLPFHTHMVGGQMLPHWTIQFHELLANGGYEVTLRLHLYMENGVWKVR